MHRLVWGCLPPLEGCAASLRRGENMRIALRTRELMLVTKLSRQESQMLSNISTLEGLREIYPPPAANSLAARCVFDHLDRHHRSFIALSPFLTIASADAQ